MTESSPWGAAKEKPKEEEGATFPCAQQHRGAAPRAPSASSPPLAPEAEFWARADATARWIEDGGTDDVGTSHQITPVDARVKAN
jgi:hypothetical protein